MRPTDMTSIPEGSPGYAVLGAFAQSGLTQTDYADHSGKAKQTVGQILRGDMRTRNLADMLSFAGYKLVAVPEKTKLNGNCYEIGGSDD